MRYLAPLLLLLACRGEPSPEPPLHGWTDMDTQPRYEPQGESAFFADGMAMRPPVEGTLARGQLGDEPRPAVDAATARRGQQRFDIYCAPCHDRSGSGKGIVVQRGFPPPVDLASERVRGLSDRELVDVITHGVRNMPAYAAQIPAADRWAIALWVRVLQRSQRATVGDVPLAMQGRIEPEGSL